MARRTGGKSRTRTAAGPSLAAEYRVRLARNLLDLKRRGASFGDLAEVARLRRSEVAALVRAAQVLDPEH